MTARRRKHQRVPLQRKRFFAAALIACTLLAIPPTRADAPPLAMIGASPTDILRRQIMAAWREATDAWKRILGEQIFNSAAPQINFVADVRPSHCYGLYISAGPVYCSGNNTVFVSLGNLQQISKQLGMPEGSGGALLVAHELGHHVQKVMGRFGLLSGLMRSNPRLQRELSLRFELEADCLAGVSAAHSPALAANAQARDDMLSTIGAMGDDKVQQAVTGVIDPARYTHGTAEQRTRWYRAGFESRSVEACSLLESEAF